MADTRTPEQLSDEERKRLQRAHERLRSASQELQALEATDPIKHRWAPEPAPPEMLEDARVALHGAYAELARCHDELLGWAPAAGA